MMQNAVVSPTSRPFMLIGQQQIRAGERASASIFDPATGEEIERMPLATAADIDSAVAHAQRAFGQWRATADERRAEVLRRAAGLLDAASPSIGLTITQEQGKVLSEAIGEVGGVSAFLRWAAEKLVKRSLPGAFPDGQLTRRQIPTPLGVVAVASPWNFPLAAAADHAIAALAQGCAVVVKPPESCPSAFAAFARIMLEAGLPEGALNVVTGEPGPIVSQLIAHSGVRKIAYTGSTEIGRSIAEQAARHLKPTILELGGNAPTLVVEDADADHAAAQIAAKKFGNAGQNCVAPNRIYVHSRLYDHFCEAMVEHARTIRTGPGIDPGSTMGPLATRRQKERLAGLAAAAEVAGGRRLSGTLQHEAGGFFHPATVFGELDDGSPLFTDEIFGPIVAIARYEDEAGLLERANAASAGLAAYVFSADPERAERLAEGLDVGMVAINTCAIGSYDLAFGGTKSSGWGYVYADMGMNEFVLQKAWTRH